MHEKIELTPVVGSVYVSMKTEISPEGCYVTASKFTILLLDLSHVFLITLKASTVRPKQFNCSPNEARTKLFLEVK